MPPSSGGSCNQDTFLHTWDRMGVVHFGNQANDQMATTEATGDMSKPELINFINNQHGVDFDTLQV